jgi:hypothetical protein
MYMNCLDKKTPYLERRLFIHGCESPLCWSLAQSQLPRSRTPLPPHCTRLHCNPPSLLPTNTVLLRPIVQKFDETINKMVQKVYILDE